MDGLFGWQMSCPTPRVFFFICRQITGCWVKNGAPSFNSVRPLGWYKGFSQDSRFIRQRSLTWFNFCYNTKQHSNALHWLIKCVQAHIPGKLFEQYNSEVHLEIVQFNRGLKNVTMTLSQELPGNSEGLKLLCSGVWWAFKICVVLIKSNFLDETQILVYLYCFWPKCSAAGLEMTLAINVIQS